MNIVFHVAATIAFNQPLNEAVNINTKGTGRIIDLYKELKHVISFIYVSTTYINAYLPAIEKKVYVRLNYTKAFLQIQLVRNTVRVSFLLVTNFTARVRNFRR